MEGIGDKWWRFRRFDTFELSLFLLVPETYSIGIMLEIYLDVRYLNRHLNLARKNDLEMVLQHLIFS